MNQIYSMAEISTDNKIIFDKLSYSCYEALINLKNKIIKSTKYKSVSHFLKELYQRASSLPENDSRQHVKVQPIKKTSHLMVRGKEESFVERSLGDIKSMLNSSFDLSRN